MTESVSMPSGTFWARLVGERRPVDHGTGGGLLALPRTPSAWLLAASMLFASMTVLRVPGLPRISYCDMLFVLAVVMGVVERIVCRDFAYTRPMLIVALVYLFCVLSLSASYLINHASPETIYFSGAHSFGYSGNFFVLIVNTALLPLVVFAIRVRSLPEFRFVIAAWAVGALYQAVYVLAYCNGYITHYDWYWIYLGRASGLTPQPNSLGIDMALTLPALLLFWCEMRSWIVRALILMGIVAIYKVSEYTGSRASLVSLIISLVAFLIVRSRYRIRGLCIGAAVLLLAVALREVIAAFPGGLDRTSALGRLILGAPYSNGVRETLNSIAYHQWVENPIFGVGYDVLRVAHNLYLQMLDAAGVVGLLGYLCALGLPLLFLLTSRALQYGRNEVAMLFSVVVTLLALAWIQTSMTDYSTSVWFGLALYLALDLYVLPTPLADGR